MRNDLPQCPTLSHARISIRLPESLDSFAKKTCRDQGMTFSEYVRSLIRSHRQQKMVDFTQPTARAKKGGAR